MSSNNNLCIPKIENIIDEQYIRQIFTKSNIGFITSYREIPWRENKEFKRIILHVYWNKNHEQFLVFQDLLAKGKCINLVHKFPSIWKIFLAKF